MASYFLCRNLNQHKDVNVFSLYCHIAHSCGSGVVYTSNHFAAPTIVCFTSFSVLLRPLFWCLDAVLNRVITTTFGWTMSPYTCLVSLVDVRCGFAFPLATVTVALLWYSLVIILNSFSFKKSCFMIIKTLVIVLYSLSI